MQVVVANEEKDGNIIRGQTVNAPGKFPLLGLAGLTTFIGITTEENEVYAVFQSIVYKSVKSRQEVKKA